MNSLVYLVYLVAMASLSLPLVVDIDFRKNENVVNI